MFDLILIGNKNKISDITVYNRSVAHLEHLFYNVGSIFEILLKFLLVLGPSLNFTFNIIL